MSAKASLTGLMVRAYEENCKGKLKSNLVIVQGDPEMGNDQNLTVKAVSSQCWPLTISISMRRDTKVDSRLRLRQNFSVWRFLGCSLPFHYETHFHELTSKALTE